MDKEPQYLLQDVLRDVTRKERRTLLGLATVAIIIAKENVKLSSINVLGLNLGNTDNDRLLFLMGLVVVYFFVAFIIYAALDLVSWRFTVADMKSKEAAENYQRDSEKQKESKEEQKENNGKQSIPYLDSEKIAEHKRNSVRYEVVKAAKETRQSYYPWALGVTLLRAAFDFVLPIFVGGYAIRLLLFR